MIFFVWKTSWGNAAKKCTMRPRVMPDIHFRMIGGYGKRATIPLRLVAEGERVRVVSFNGGRGFLERNLYLTVQLREMKVSVVLALNMMDIAKSRKIEIDLGNSGRLFERLSLSGEYTTALNDFEKGALYNPEDTEKRTPKSWNIEPRYAFTDVLSAALRYGGGADDGDAERGEFLAESQTGAVVKAEPLENTSLALEYLNSRYEGDYQTVERMVLSAGCCTPHYQPEICRSVACDRRTKSRYLKLVCPAHEFMMLADQTRLGRELSGANGIHSNSHSRCYLCWLRRQLLDVFHIRLRCFLLAALVSS